MSGKSFLSTSSLSLRKIVLIKVLVVVLGFVLFGSEQASTESAPSPATRAPRAITQAALQADASGNRLTAQWPEFNLQSVLRANPFETILVAAPQPPVTKVPDPKRPPAKSPSEPKAVPPEEPKSALKAAPPAKPKTIIERRPHDKVAIIYENESERVAVIESRLVRVGDVLSEGRVVAITPDHVIIEAVLLVD